MLSLLLAAASNPGWGCCADHDAAGRHVARHGRARADGRSVAHGDVAENRASRAKTGSAAYRRVALGAGGDARGGDVEKLF